MGHLLSARHCAKHFTWISSWYRCRTRHIREFPQRVELKESESKAFPWRGREASKTQPLSGAVTCPGAEVGREPELDWGWAT